MDKTTAVVPIASPYHCVLALDTQEKVSQWNDIVDAMISQKEWYGHYGERIAGIPSPGLSYANVDEFRTNPEVALVVRSPNITLGVLHRKRGDMTALMGELLAFVPYSCIFPSSRRYTHTLILPMGLQKTPGGFGFSSPPNPLTTPVVTKEGFVRYAKQPGEIAGVLPRLLSVIKARHPKMAVLTRFAKRYGVAEWQSGGIRQWESQFPGHMRLGWLSYRAFTDFDDDSEDIKRLNAEINELHARRRGKKGDERRWVHLCMHIVGGRSINGVLETRRLINAQINTLDAAVDELWDLNLNTVRVRILEEASAVEFPDTPATYQPGEGGASIDETTLVVTDSSGKELLQVRNIDTIRVVSRLVDPQLSANLGTLLCAWT